MSVTAPPMGWAVLNRLNQIDSYYTSLDRAKERARMMAHTDGRVSVVELRVILRIKAEQGPWVYTELPPVDDPVTRPGDDQ